MNEKLYAYYHCNECREYTSMRLKIVAYDEISLINYIQDDIDNIECDVKDLTELSIDELNDNIKYGFIDKMFINEYGYYE